MNFEQDKHGPGMVCSIGGLTARYRKVSTDPNDNKYFAEFNNMVRYDLVGEEAAQEYIKTKYESLMLAISTELGQ